jgi:hypothetical protein
MRLGGGISRREVIDIRSVESVELHSQATAQSIIQTGQRC